MSDYEVLARKWRPQTFEEVVGQEHVSRTLRNAIRLGRVGHAYLFTGPRGIGKTSTARIFAKALNCEQGPSEIPCNQCPLCREIAAGTCLDVLEIDGASNRGIDQIRDLRENVKFAPSSARFKIYIIDEVHMLTAEAFNALLKTLEEPPSHVKFFFATTMPEKVLATIQSRCQRFDLRRISVSEIRSHLYNIALKEEIQVEEAALVAIAKSAEGSLRDAESVLDQLISFCGKEVDYGKTIQVLGRVSREQVSDLVENLFAERIEAALKIVNDLVREGKTLDGFVRDVSGHLRDLLVVKASDQPEGLTNETPERLADMAALAKRLSQETLLRLLDLFMRAEDTMHRSGAKKMLLEVTLFRAFRIVRGVTIDDLFTRLELMEEAGPGKRKEPLRTGEPGHMPGQDVAREDPAASRSRDVKPPEEASNEEDAFALDKERWMRVVQSIGESKPLLKALLEEGAFLRAGAADVVLGFRKENQFQMNQLKQEENRRAMEAAAQEIWGRPLRFHTKLLERAAGNGDPASGTEKTQQQISEEGDRANGAPLEDPLIQKALDLFDGEIEGMDRRE